MLVVYIGRYCFFLQFQRSRMATFHRFAALLEVSLSQLVIFHAELGVHYLSDMSVVKISHYVLHWPGSKLLSLSGFMCLIYVRRVQQRPILPTF
ncbi:hypothetical protein NC651_011188 [Populus alba x Populus x berolinensis]|nr:hypothetical protein NC651_011188 [Populus alba x Populus x berolinensis]